MKLAHLAIITLLLTACGSKSKSTEQPNIPQQDVSAYLAKYQELARSRWNKPDFTVTTSVSIAAVLDNSDSTAIGGCTTTTHSIQLLKRWWDAANGVERQATVYHELGHCEQYRDHLDTKRSDGTPASLMAANAFEWEIYQANGQFYDDELMSIVNKCGTAAALPCPTAN